ncbi:hypothetical protein [Microbulbifer sp. TYP-18]|uniref:phage adaptor protein n=1 Tax=Microbulbifer sp. TYP-18 TaxID=3230024 RepID=UPI0034C626A4
MARQYRTLEKLRQQLSARLGFGGQAGASSVNAPILNSFLYDAQQQLWEQVDWHHLIRFADKTVGYGQRLLEYPQDCDPERVLSVAVYDGVEWLPLARGIDWQHRDPLNTLDRPCRWEMADQLELHPQADRTYPLRIRYVRKPDRFEGEGDRASLNDNLIFLHALYNAKLHYRQPDADRYGAQLESELLQVKSRSRGRRVHRRKIIQSDPYGRAPRAADHV